MKRHDRAAQARGRARPPQVAEPRATTTLSRFGVARDGAGPGTMPGSSASLSQHTPKFRRAPPQLRREALIGATLECLRKFGHEGLSVRRIGAQAGVSPGLIIHHFPSVSALLAAAYETLAMSLLNSIQRHARAADVSARERLRRFYEASFTPALLDPALFNTWLVFWSMISHDAGVQGVHDRTYAAYRAALESLLGQLQRSAGVPRFRLRPAAIALSALLDGLWIEASINPSAFRPVEAVALCEDWTTALCAGAFPSLLVSRRSALRPQRARRSGS